MSVFIFNFNKIFDNLNYIILNFLNYIIFFSFFYMYNVDNLHIKYLLISQCLIEVLH